MKFVFTILMICFSGSITLFGRDNDDIIIVFYATYKGKTGHIGIAVDNYRIIYREETKGGSGEEKPDTVTSGELTYFDLWPDDDHFRVTNTGKDIPAVYYRLPVSSTEEITLNSLYDKGIPHKEHYPADGILRIPTNWEQDQQMIRFLDSMVTAQRAFNARRFNCTDFVRVALEHLLQTSLNAREFVIAGWSSTPNKLYRQLRKLNQVRVLKNADEKAERSFIGQRVIYKLFHRT